MPTQTAPSAQHPPVLIPGARLILLVGAAVVDHNVSHGPAGTVRGRKARGARQQPEAAAAVANKRRLARPRHPPTRHPPAATWPLIPPPTSTHQHPPDACIEQVAAQLSQLLGSAVLAVQIQQLPGQVALGRDGGRGRWQPQVGDARSDQGRHLGAQVAPPAVALPGLPAEACGGQG